MSKERKVYLLNDAKLAEAAFERDISCTYKKIKYTKFINKINEGAFSYDSKLMKYRSALVNISWFGMPQLYTLVDIMKIQDFKLNDLQRRKNISSNKEYLEYFIAKGINDCPVHESSTTKIPLEDLNISWWIGLYGAKQIIEHVNNVNEHIYFGEFYNIGFGPNVDIEDPDYTIEKLNFESKMPEYLKETMITLNDETFLQIGNTNLYYKFNKDMFATLFDAFSTGDIKLTEVYKIKKDKEVESLVKRNRGTCKEVNMHNLLLEFCTSAYFDYVFSDISAIQTISFEFEYKNTKLSIDYKDINITDENGLIVNHQFSMPSIIYYLIKIAKESDNHEQ